MPLRRRTAPSDRSAIVRLCLTLMRGGQRLRPRCSRAWAVLPSLPPTRRRRPCLGRSGSAAASSDRPLRRPQRRRLTRAVDTPPASRSERRTREAAELVGNALAAGHDVDALLPVILESAVTITGSAGARLVADGNEVARAGVIEERSRPLAIPLVAGSTGDGMLVLYPPPGRELDNDAVQLAEWLAGRAAIALQNAHLHRLARQLATTDELTQLANRRQFDEALAAEVVRAERFRDPVAVVLADLDNFKEVNDRFGHEVGDLVLRAFAAAIRINVRDVDLPARYGGEEFAILLPATDADGGMQLAERLRVAAEELTLDSGGGGPGARGGGVGGGGVSRRPAPAPPPL